jgi:predicted nucleotidyltransferase
MYSQRMKKSPAYPARTADYIHEVIQLAHARCPAIVNISIFGSVAKGGFSQTVSDVDLIVVLADEAPQQMKRIISDDLAALELKHGLRTHPNSKLERVYTTVDRIASQFKSYFVCYKRDLLSGNTAAVFDVNPLIGSLVLSTHIGFAGIVKSSKVIWGEDFRYQIHIPALTKAHLVKNCAAFLLLNACALMGYPFLPNATRYSMSALKWMLHTCYFCYTLESATIEEEIDFFRTKLGERKPFSELLSLRQEYRSSFAFIRRCFSALSRLYVVTARDNEFPITVELT